MNVRVAILLLLPFCLADQVDAAVTSAWNVNSGGLWSAAGNWTNGVPATAGDTASLTFNITAARTITNDVARSVGVLNIGDSTSSYFGYTLTNNGGATFTFDNNGSGASLVQSTTTASDVIATAVTLNDNLSIKNNSASATLVLSGVVSGNKNILKLGAGTLTLSGANTFTGSMTVTNGTVNLTGSAGSATGGWLMPVNLAPATVNFQAGSVIGVASSNAVQVGSYPANGTPNNQTLNVAGTVTNNGTLLVARGGILNVNSGGVWLQNGGMTNSPPGGSGYSAVITINSGGAFIYRGTNVIVLSPSAGNGGSGTLTVNGGLFTTAQGFTNTIGPAGSSGYAQIVLTSNGTLGLSANIPQFTSGQNTNSLPSISLGAGGGSLNTAGFSTAITNLIGGSGALAKLGAGTLTLGAVNPYTGATVVSNGTLVVSGSIPGSPMVTVAATNATLQLAQSASLANTALLVVNAGGRVAVNSGVNQTVGALCLGGQWAGDGTWGSTASAAANQNDAYFSGGGFITVAHGNPSPDLSSSFISSWYVRYYGGSYDNVNPAPGVIAYMPYPGWDYVPTSSANIKSYTYQYSHGLPLAVYFLEGTAPVGDNTNTIAGTYMRSNAVADTVAYFTTNTAPARPLNYVLSDFEPYDQTLAHCELEITNLVNLVRASPNTNVSSAFVGNYACYAGGTDPALTPSSRIGTDAFYRGSGLNAAQPNAYPYPAYTNNGPNARSGLFWSDLELVSFAKLNLPAGHRLLPWLNDTLTGDPVGVPTVDDCVALMAHVRLRGADGFSDLGGLVNLTYGWTDLDWLFHGAGGSQIYNLATDKASGLQWSGFRVGENLAFLFSNLGNSAGAVSLPDFPGLPSATPLLAAGSHTAWYFVNDPGAVAAAPINLGRNGINHALFLNGTFTLTNPVTVADPGADPAAAVIIGSSVTNDFSPVLAGPLTLNNNNVTLQSYARNLTIAGDISGSGGITNAGVTTLSGTAGYTGATLINAGTLWVNGALSYSAVTVAVGGAVGGSGTIGGPVEVAGSVSPGSDGVGTLTTGDETWDGGGAYVFQLADATNNSGADFLNITGALNLSASAGSPFTIHLVSLNTSNLPGPATGFARTNGYSWPLVAATGGILNFDPAAFVVDTASFSNAFAGAFSVTSDGSSLMLNYMPAIPPVINPGGLGFSGGAFAFSFSGASGQGYRVLASTNLQLPLTNWLVLTNGLFSPGTMSFTDRAATNLREFYRLASP